MEETNNSRYIDVIYVVIKDILKNWLSIICVAISAVLISYIIASLCYAPVYTSSCTMVVSAKENLSGAYANVSQTQKLTDTFKAIMDSNVLKKKAAEVAGYSSFGATLEIKVVENTNLLEVSVTSDNSLKSFKLLNALIDTYPEISKEVLGKVVIQIFESPNFPSSPSNSFIYTNTIAIAFLFAAAIVIFIIALHSYYYDNVKNEWDATEKLDSKMLGVIYHESPYRTLTDRIFRKKKRLLIGAPSVSFGFSETIKKIRTNMIYFQEKHGGNTILVTSYHKKAGKSLVAANLAVALTQQGKSVLLISGGYSSDYLINILNLNFPIEFLEDYKNDLSDLVYTKNGSLLSVLINPSGKTFSSETNQFNAVDKFEKFIKNVKSDYDYIIIDGPSAKNSANAEYFAKFCDFSVLVVKQNGSKVAHLNDTIDMLSKYNYGISGYVFNDVYTSVVVINAGYSSSGYRNKNGKYGKYGKYGSYGKYSSYNLTDEEIDTVYIEGKHMKHSKKRGRK